PGGSAFDLSGGRRCGRKSRGHGGAGQEQSAVVAGENCDDGAGHEGFPGTRLLVGEAAPRLRPFSKDAALGLEPYGGGGNSRGKLRFATTAAGIATKASSGLGAEI